MVVPVELPDGGVFDVVDHFMETFQVTSSWWSSDSFFGKFSWSRVRGRVLTEGQEECPNYFGTLTPKVKAVLVDLHTEMWRLGISNAVMHNEVAPGQHEISPIFALSNVSADQNALCQVFFFGRLRLGPGVRHLRSW